MQIFDRTKTILFGIIFSLKLYRISISFPCSEKSLSIQGFPGLWTPCNIIAFDVTSLKFLNVLCWHAWQHQLAASQQTHHRPSVGEHYSRSTTLDKQLWIKCSNSQSSGTTAANSDQPLLQLGRCSASRCRSSAIWMSLEYIGLLLLLSRVDNIVDDIHRLTSRLYWAPSLSIVDTVTALPHLPCKLSIDTSKGSKEICHITIDDRRLSCRSNHPPATLACVVCHR